MRQYRELYEYIRRLWSPRETERYGAIVEPLLQWTKLQTIEKQTQVVPCRAGVLSAVVYANGDVGLCETHAPLANLRNKKFWEIWDSPEAHALREKVSCKECWCTTEVFMWQSIVFQPYHLARAMLGAKVWQKPTPLRADERVPLGVDVLAKKTSGDVIPLEISTGSQ